MKCPTQNVEKDIVFDWGKMKKARDRYIGRLNGIYEDGLDKLKVYKFFQSIILSVRSFTFSQTIFTFISISQPYSLILN